MVPDEYTSFTESDGSVKEGTACSKCGTSYEACTRQLRFSNDGCCCGTCHRVNTHRERRVWVAIDPKIYAPRDGDQVLYEGDDGAIFGGEVTEARLDSDKHHRFRIIGHEGLFNHVAEPPWKRRRILRPANRPAPAPNERLVAMHDLVQELHRRLHPSESLRMLPHEIGPAWTEILDEVAVLVKGAATAERMKQRLDVIERRVDRVDLAKRLFAGWCRLPYADRGAPTLDDLWQEADGEHQKRWLALADLAIVQLLARDVPRDQ